MGQMRDRMEGDLLLKGLAEVPRAQCLRCATRFAAHYRRSRRALRRRLIAAHDVGQPFQKQLALAVVAKDGLAFVPARRHVSSRPQETECAAAGNVNTTLARARELIENNQPPSAPSTPPSPPPSDTGATGATEPHSDGTADDLTKPKLRCPHCAGTTFSLIATLLPERRRRTQPPPDT